MSRYLPEEIILNILFRLEVKSLLRFRCVCKSWCNLLTSNNLEFVRMHLHHAVDDKNNKNNNCTLVLNCLTDFYLIDSVSSSSSELCYEAVKIETPFKPRLSVDNTILGSCNGLLCSTANYGGDNLYIWNPSNKEYWEISQPRHSSWYNYIVYGFGYDYIAYGFGYDCKTDDYKLVRIESPPSVAANFEVTVYTLRSSSWRKVQSVPHNRFFAKRQAGVLLKGALHWIKTHPTVQSQESQVIVYFNIGDERFQEIELPNCLVGKSTSNVVVLRGDLCVLGHMSDSHDLWVMKDYEVIESWTKLFSIPIDKSIWYLKPIYSFKNGEILFGVGLNEENGYNGLVSYDPNCGRGRLLKIRGRTPICFDDIDTYVGSLVSPNQFTFVRAQLFCVRNT